MSDSDRPVNINENPFEVLARPSVPSPIRWAMPPEGKVERALFLAAFKKPDHQPGEIPPAQVQRYMELMVTAYVRKDHAAEQEALAVLEKYKLFDGFVHFPESARPITATVDGVTLGSTFTGSVLLTPQEEVAGLRRFWDELNITREQPKLAAAPAALVAVEVTADVVAPPHPKQATSPPVATKASATIAHRVETAETEVMRAPVSITQLTNSILQHLGDKKVQQALAGLDGDGEFSVNDVMRLQTLGADGEAQIRQIAAVLPQPQDATQVAQQGVPHTGGEGPKRGSR